MCKWPTWSLGGWASNVQRPRGPAVQLISCMVACDIKKTSQRTSKTNISFPILRQLHGAAVYQGDGAGRVYHSLTAIGTQYHIPLQRPFAQDRMNVTGTARRRGPYDLRDGKN